MYRSKLIISMVILLLCSTTNTIAGSIDLQTRSFTGGPINPSTVNKLQLNWTDPYLTVPDTGDANTPFGSISSTPALKGKFLYFNDMSGNISKLNRFTGGLVWKKNYVQDISSPGFGIGQSRNTPYIIGNLLISGSNYGVIEPLCKVTGGSPAANVCHTGDGAVVVALDKNTGKVVWRIKVDKHPASKITGSISGQGNIIYVPVASWEEDWSRAYPDIETSPIDPNSQYKCCSARGSLVGIDVTVPKILWKTYIVPGGTLPNGTQSVDDPLDQNPALSGAMKALLTPRGFFGASPYGEFPTIDTARSQIYIATAQNETAPKVAEDCEKNRRDPSYPAPILPAGVTCSNLNDKLHNYASSVIALDMNTGKIKWVYHSRSYDAWNHACAAPDFYGFSVVPPIVFPVTSINNHNCFQDPVGPDNGFGHNPVLVRNAKLANGSSQDVLVVGNKDGRIFGLDPTTGHQIWLTTADPGGIFGGPQLGIATDGQRVYFGTSNSSNTNRDHNLPFVSNKTFLDYNGFTKVGVRVGLYSQGDNGPLVPFPAPSGQNLPFFGPSAVYGDAGYPVNYPTVFPNTPATQCVPLDPTKDVNDIDNYCGPLQPYIMSVPASGPREYWTLVNPPPDVSVDGVTVFNQGGHLTTIDGSVNAIDPGTGTLLWQRPANDGIVGSLLPAIVHGKLTVGNGLVFIGYTDSRGTMVVLDAKTGVKLFQFQAKIPVGGVMTAAGGIESAPQVVGRRVYWGVGAETPAYFPKINSLFSQTYISGGNRLYSFILPPSGDSTEDEVDANTNDND